MALVRVTAIVWVVFAAVANPTVLVPQQNPAAETWEAAIRAKGGRERLLQIDNVVISATSTWGIPFRRYDVTYETLFVMPSQLWEWEDERPTKFGLSLAIADLARDREQYVYDGAPPNPPGKARDPRRVHQVAMLQAITFMETRWLKPALRGIHEDRIGLRKVTVVEANIGDQTVDFYLDDKSHLPARVLFRGPGPNWFEQYDLSNYREVNGLQLPHEVTKRDPGFGGPSTQRTAYQLNVDYDPGLFDRPPSLERGPKGWQRTAGTPR